MFEKLVVSTTQRRKHRTAKFFVGTVLLYAIAIASAFVISVFVSDTRLADTSSVIAIALPPAISGSTTPKPPGSKRPPQTDVARDPNHTMTLDQLLSRRNDHPPIIPTFDHQPGGPGMPGSPGPPGISTGPGVPDGDLNVAPPPRPDPLPVKPAANTTVTNHNPVRLTSTVLQGKAIERRVPVYPELVRRIHLQGDVAVEVIISPEGRVESARAISGHPMLIATALEAARGWRFGPTILNGVPVRVTGVITFVFKLTE
jgi:protein TonB